MQSGDAVPLYPKTAPYNVQAMDSIEKNVQQQNVQPQMPARALLGPENTVTTCPFCCASIKTSVKYTTTTRTHISAALCCMICCLCCVPYCSDSAKNSDHYCPNCLKYIGTYEK